MALFSNGSCNTSNEDRKGLGESDRGREPERTVGDWDGDGKTRKVYSQSSEFGVGLEEKLWEEQEFVSVDATGGKNKENIVKFKWFHFINLKYKPQKGKQLINHSDSCFVLTELSLTRQLDHLEGQRVHGSEVKLMGMSA